MHLEGWDRRVAAENNEPSAQATKMEPKRAEEVGWFAVRQPGIVRFLEQRLLHGDGDAFAVALEAAVEICGVFGRRDRLPPRRVERSLLERAESAVLQESSYGDAFPDGCASRQPELCTWLVDHLHSLPLPLDADELAAVGTCLFAIVYVFDEQITGRQIR